MTPRCTAIKGDGERCGGSATGADGLCWAHDPANADARRRMASRAGKSTGGREIRDLKRRISGLVDAVLEGSQDRGRAAVAIQGFNALKGVLELERKVREVDELETRLEALEQATSSREKGGQRWGA